MPWVDLKLAEAALLTSHARLALSTGEPIGLSLEHPLFKYTSTIIFETDAGQGWPGPASQVANHPEGWCEYLRASGASAIALQSGGVIRVTGTGPEHVWHQTMDVLQPKPADGRLWAVRYRAFESKNVGTPPELTVDDASARLREVLQGCESLARDAGEGGWAKFFGNASMVLNQPAEVSSQKCRLLPARGYSAAAHRLLRACELSWAFGGMGSWNDLYIDDSRHARRYDELTPQLKKALDAGISAAVNSEPSAG